MKFVLAHDKDQSMKRSRFSEEQIIGILKEHEGRVAWHYIAPGKPMQNAFIESFNGRCAMNC